MNQETINRLNKAREHNSDYIPRRLFWKGIVRILLFWMAVSLITFIYLIIKILWKY